MKLLVESLLKLIILELALSAGEVLEMKCDEIKAISYYDRYYGTKCTISDVSANSSDQFIVRSANSFEYNKIIQEVEFTRSRLYDFPREIFGTFQYLKKVQANSCGLQDVNKYNFNYASALQELRMRSNKIKKLPNSVFTSVTTLTTLDLSSNEISEIEKSAFAGLVNLEFLTLTNNKLVLLHESILKELTSLISIRLDSNKLQIVDENMFEGNLNISEIRLDSNEIAVVNGDVFSKLKRLKLLNLASNRLHSINIVNTNLERLWMAYNSLKYIDINKSLKLLHAPYNELEAISFAGNTDMLELRLRQNCISDISNFTRLDKLEILDLSYNPVGELKISSFARMNDLVKLNLENTKIEPKSLTFGTFAHNMNLTHLDISYNQLQKIDFNIFTSLSQLSHLKIDGNNLTGIPYDNIRATFPKLSLISLVDNDWNCSYLTKMIKKLREINVIVYVFTKLRVLEEMNVDGIRCHQNTTDHVYWKKPILHLDDNEIDERVSENPSMNLKPKSPVLQTDLIKVWDRISELQLSLAEVRKGFINEQLQMSSSQQTPQRSESTEKDDHVLQSEISFIRVILCLMFFVMMFFMLMKITKFIRSYYDSQQRFYYPSVSLRRSTATIQTTMDNVM